MSIFKISLDTFPNFFNIITFTFFIGVLTHFFLILKNQYNIFWKTKEFYARIKEGRDIVKIS